MFSAFLFENDCQSFKQNNCMTKHISPSLCLPSNLLIWTNKRKSEAFDVFFFTHICCLQIEQSNTCSLFVFQFGFDSIRLCRRWVQKSRGFAVWEQDTSVVLRGKTTISLMYQLTIKRDVKYESQIRHCSTNYVNVARTGFSPIFWSKMNVILGPRRFFFLRWPLKPLGIISQVLSP